MFVPKENIKAVYRYILTEGVIVIKKDNMAPKHLEIPVPNIQVINILKSLRSRGCVTEQFSWSHYYYCLTDDGILYLRKYLHLPDNVIPATVAKASRSAPTSSNANAGGSSSGNDGRGFRREGRNTSSPIGANASGSSGGTWRAKAAA